MRISTSIDQPLKLAGFNMGVPAPAGAGLALLPLIFWFATDHIEIARDWRVVLPWTILVAFLMVSNLPTLGWKRLRLPPSLRLFAIGAAGLVAALLLTAPWPMLLALCVLYLACCCRTAGCNMAASSGSANGFDPAAV